MPVDLPTIAIIGGTGKQGTGLALRWAFAGYKIIIGSRQEGKAQLAARAINEQLAIDTTHGFSNNVAVKYADICVLTVVYPAHQHTLESLKNELAGKILVDATSRVDYLDPKLPEPPSIAQRAQDFLGSSVQVVAAFQNVPAKILTHNIGRPIDADVLVCADDQQAADQVVSLARAAGMRGYYAGSLANAIVVESLTSILIQMNQHYKVKHTSIKISGIPDN